MPKEDTLIPPEKPGRNRGKRAAGPSSGEAKAKRDTGPAKREAALDAEPADAPDTEKDEEQELAPDEDELLLEAGEDGGEPDLLDLGAADEGETIEAAGGVTKALAPSPRGSSSDPLQLYLREISRFPLLTAEEEQLYAHRVRDQGDRAAAFKLITSHLRLVVKIAMDFQRRWMQNVLDLIQEGNVGLMRAVQKFDPDKGIKFSYYAAYWVRAYILKYIMDNWRLVKIGTTQAQRKLFYNLNKERQRLINEGFDPTASNISQSLNVSESDVMEMDQRLARSDLSLNMQVGEDSSATRLDFLPSLAPGIEEVLGRNEIGNMLNKHLRSITPKLSEKEKILLEKRLLSDNPLTLREIGAQYGITRERVRQIESRLLEKIRQHLASRIKDFSPEWVRKDE